MDRDLALVRVGLGKVAEMNLQEAAQQVVRKARILRFEKPVEVPFAVFVDLLNALEDEQRAQEGLRQRIARQGLKDLRAAIYGESK